MKLQKWVATLLAVVFFCANLSLAAAQATQELTLLEKVGVTEKFFYGQDQTGSLVDRVTRLETDVYGVNSKNALTVKVERLYNYVKDSSIDAPSFLLKLNAVEWALAHTVTSGPAKNRLEQVEQSITGQIGTGSFEGRLDKLLKLAYTDGQIGATNATITKDTLVKIKLTSALDSKTAKAGDTVAFQAADDVLVNGILVIGKGAEGSGKVLKAEGAQNFGRDAQLQLSFDSLKTMDGKEIATVLGEKAKEQNKSMATAAGASIAGMAILGPVGIVGGIFVHGKEIKLPAGTEFFVQTKTDSEAYGIQVK
ncbi:hypothetical protein [Azotosporobacter soli]|uniref:hypothetical protein n=1 Tax=Azotosporobacter soli TaxID=3055040 RepID=UPI0031FE7653